MKTAEIWQTIKHLIFYSAVPTKRLAEFFPFEYAFKAQRGVENVTPSKPVIVFYQNASKAFLCLQYEKADDKHPEPRWTLIAFLFEVTDFDVQVVINEPLTEAAIEKVCTEHFGEFGCTSADEMKENLGKKIEELKNFKPKSEEGGKVISIGFIPLTVHESK